MGSCWCHSLRAATRRPTGGDGSGVQSKPGSSPPRAPAQPKWRRPNKENPPVNPSQINTASLSSTHAPPAHSYPAPPLSSTHSTLRSVPGNKKESASGPPADWAPLAPGLALGTRCRHRKASPAFHRLTETLALWLLQRYLKKSGRTLTSPFPFSLFFFPDGTTSPRYPLLPPPGSDPSTSGGLQKSRYWQRRGRSRSRYRPGSPGPVHIGGSPPPTTPRRHVPPVRLWLPPGEAAVHHVVHHAHRRRYPVKGEPRPSSLSRPEAPRVLPTPPQVESQNLTVRI